MEVDLVQRLRADTVISVLFPLFIWASIINGRPRLIRFTKLFSQTEQQPPYSILFNFSTVQLRPLLLSPSAHHVSTYVKTARPSKLTVRFYIRRSAQLTFRLVPGAVSPSSFLRPAEADFTVPAFNASITTCRCLLRAPVRCVGFAGAFEDNV